MTATLEGGEWSATRPSRTLPPGNNRYPFYRRPQGRSGGAEKSRLHWHSIPDRPARSQSLYRLSYPAHNNNIIVMFFSVTNSTASPYFVSFILFFCTSTSLNDSDIRKDIQPLKLFTFVKIYPRPCRYLYTLLK